MKNFLRKFEFYSGFYENVFYQQFYAINPKDAIIQTVASFIDKDEDITEKVIADLIGSRNTGTISEWNSDDFWEHCDMNFSSDTEGYRLIYIKEINTDLDKL